MVQARNISPPITVGIDKKAAQVRVALTAVCDAAMPRARRMPNRKQIY